MRLPHNQPDRAGNLPKVCWDWMNCGRVGPMLVNIQTNKHAVQQNGTQNNPVILLLCLGLVILTFAELFLWIPSRFWVYSVIHGLVFRPTVAVIMRWTLRTNNVLCWMSGTKDETLGSPEPVAVCGLLPHHWRLPLCCGGADVKCTP